jgi:hypothetical protein
LITIKVTYPDSPVELVDEAIKSGLDSATSMTAKLQKNNAPVNTGTLKRSIYGDFTQLDNFKAAVIQDPLIAPYGKITNDGYPGIIVPKNAKALKLHTKSGIIYRKQVKGQAGTHWWERILLQTAEIQEAFVTAFDKILKG